MTVVGCCVTADGNSSSSHGLACNTSDLPEAALPAALPEAAVLDCAKEGLACAQTTQANSTHAQTGRKELGGLAFSSGQYLIMQCTFFQQPRILPAN